MSSIAMMLGDYARLAADGRFEIPVVQTFTSDDWRKAMQLSMSGQAHGKLVLVLERGDQA